MKWSIVGTVLGLVIQLIERLRTSVKNASSIEITLDVLATILGIALVIITVAGD